ncbi:hypothetical protein GCM10022290_21150 [Sagittula marina]
MEVVYIAKDGLCRIDEFAAKDEVKALHVHAPVGRGRKWPFRNAPEPKQTQPGVKRGGAQAAMAMVKKALPAHEK